MNPSDTSLDLNFLLFFQGLLVHQEAKEREDFQEHLVAVDPL